MIRQSWPSYLYNGNPHTERLVQERCNSSVLAMELGLSCINSSIHRKMVVILKLVQHGAWLIWSAIHMRYACAGATNSAWEGPGSPSFELKESLIKSCSNSIHNWITIKYCQGNSAVVACDCFFVIHSMMKLQQNFMQFEFCALKILVKQACNHGVMFKAVQLN